VFHVVSEAGQHAFEEFAIEGRVVNDEDAFAPGHV
jgi:hypothetical protein